MRLPDTEPGAPGKILDHDAGMGEASEATVDKRARELAKIAGLDPDEAADEFHQQAREELSGRADENAPADEEGAIAGLTSYDDVPGESGGAVSPSTHSAASGDEETIGESLYAEGINEAGHDRMVSSRDDEYREARDEEK